MILAYFSGKKNKKKNNTPMGCGKDVTHTHTFFKDTTVETHQLLTAADEILLWDEAVGGNEL